MTSIFWRLWSLVLPTTFGLMLFLFYRVLPAATCKPHDAECFALAWALWIVGCYAFAAVAVALRIILRPARAPQHETDQLKRTADRAGDRADRAGDRLARKSLLVAGHRSE